MDSSWDRLLDLIDHLAAQPTQPVDHDIETRLQSLCAESMADGYIDSELDARDSARWLGGLLVAYRTLRESHPHVDPDDELADLRRIATRWLHPARPR